MSQWLDNANAENICDVGCGIGNLILTYLEYVGEKKQENYVGILFFK